MTEKDFNKIKKDNPNAEVFVTLGGDGVVFNDTGVIDRISDNLVEFYNSGFKFDGLDFDMESDFRNIGFDKCVDIVSKVKSGRKVYQNSVYSFSWNVQWKNNR